MTYSDTQNIELNKESLSDQIFGIVRNRIINLDIPPGEKIDVETLTEEFDVSIAPVRDAMKSLNERGLVTIKPRVGYFSRKLNTDDVKNVCDMRELFELYALGEAVGNIPESQILECKKEVKRIQQNDFAPEEKREQFDLNDEELHQNIILDNAENNLLKDFTDRIHDLVSLTQHLNKRIDQALDEHFDILEALESANESKARTYLKYHLKEVRKETIKGVKNEKYTNE